MDDFINFRRMLTPQIIKIVFLLQVGFSLLFGLVTLFTGDGIGWKFMGLVIMVVGPFIARIVSETMIVAFTINDTLTDIRAELRQR